MVRTFTGPLQSIFPMVLSTTVMSDILLFLIDPGIVSVTAGFAVTTGVSLLEKRNVAFQTT